MLFSKPSRIVFWRVTGNGISQILIFSEQHFERSDYPSNDGVVKGLNRKYELEL